MAEKKAKISSASEDYGAANITILEGLEAVRKRPAMYIGDSGVDGLHHLVKEIVDNAIDEALAGRNDHVGVELLPENGVRVIDHGAGIPVDMHPKAGVSALEVVATQLHAGGKFDDKAYKVSGGLHGVGLAVVNALCKKMVIRVFKDGNVYQQEYERGVPKYPTKKTGEKSKDTGTTIEFYPDEEIFADKKFNFKRILTSFRQQAYLTGGVMFRISDGRSEEERTEQKDEGASKDYSFYFDGGVKSYVRQLNKNYKSIQNQIFYVNEEVDVANGEDKEQGREELVGVEVAL
ncbi:MAG: ATP-binding protein, partial [Candidatus Dojkabacteria bacterium]